MRADHAVRHNAAVGALVGLAVADGLAAHGQLPPRVCATACEPLVWTHRAKQTFDAAERFLRGDAVDMGLSAIDIAGIAIGLIGPDARPLLLVDPDAVLMSSLIATGLQGQLACDEAEATETDLQHALIAVRHSDTYEGAVAAAMATGCTPAIPLTGLLAGLRWGPASIPAAWSTSTSGPVESRTYHLRQLRRLAERLMRFDAPIPPEPRRSLGPREVAPKLWLSNLHAVPRFIADHPDGAVISLCPTTGEFDDHPVRREFALHDAAGSKVNPHLSAVVDEILATIAAFHDDDRDVLVHCHHGASRTGLVLRAWLGQELDLSWDDATTEAQVRWSKTSTWNNAFSAEIKRRCGRD